MENRLDKVSYKPKTIQFEKKNPDEIIDTIYLVCHPENNTGIEKCWLW